MGEVWSNFNYETTGKEEYELLKELFIKIQEKNKNVWSVEKWEETQYKIQFESVMADEQEIVDLAKVVDGWLNAQAKNYKKSGKEELAAVAKSAKFKVEGKTEYYNSGERTEYIIERTARGMTIRETPTFVTVEAEDYEEFCEYVTGDPDEPCELLDEEDFDPENWYAVVDDEKLYVNKTPPYGRKTALENYRKLSAEELKAVIKAISKGDMEEEDTDDEEEMED